jgi:NADH dehydrogenase
MGRRERKKEITKERIVQKAFELFKTHGYKQTSVEMIVQKAGIAKGTFFNYFPSKELLLTELQHNQIEQAFTFLESAHIQPLSFIKQMIHLFRFLLSYFDVDPDVTRDAFISRYSDEAGSEIIQLCKQVIRQAQRRGELRNDIEALHMAECCYGLFLSSLYVTNTPSSKEMVMQDLSQKLSLCFEGFMIQKGHLHMKTNIVILGGGYGGLRIIQRMLAASLSKDVQLTLVDRMPYHCLKTEYYALAAGTEPDSALRVSFPNDPRLLIKFAEITEIDLEKKFVHLKDQERLSYDYLVVALGCEDRFHGVEGAQEHALSIQTIAQTRQTYQALNNVKPYGKVCIVGGGLSGVELASELRESRADLTIQIYDRGESILHPFPERLRQYVRTWFINHDVEMVNKASITKVEPHTLYNYGEPVPCDAVVWAAGIQANRIVRELPVERDTMGRALLTEHHHIPEYPEVFVCGDCASLPHAPSAQLAEGQGDQIALVLQAMLENKPLPKLPKIKLKGVLGSLGKKHGFGLMGETTLLGRVPRVLKSGVLWMYRHHSG